ncbi:MAG: GNAT family protein [Bacteroidota bacterium]
MPLSELGKSRWSLRPWRTSDFGRIAELANNPKIACFLTDMFPHPYSIEDAKRYFQTFSEACIIRAICIDDVFVGSVGLHAKQDVHRHEMELGYWLGEPYWGNGIVSWAIPEILPLGFARPDVVRIYAEVMAHNPASARVLEKCGFKFEGRLELGFFKKGEYVDSLRYALVRPMP